MIIAFCGHSRCGKDEACNYFASFNAGRFTGSISKCIAPLLAKDLELDPEVAYEDRHSYSMFWKEWCDNYRKDDPTKLVKAVLATGSTLISGVRGKIELETCLEQGVIDLAVWVERDVPTDPTLEYDRSLCSRVIDNTSGLRQYHRELYALLAELCQEGQPCVACSAGTMVLGSACVNNLPVCDSCGFGLEEE